MFQTDAREDVLDMLSNSASKPHKQDDSTTIVPPQTKQPISPEAKRK